MITQLFHQASVDLEGLEELIENSSLSSQNQLVDTEDFIYELGDAALSWRSAAYFRRFPRKHTDTWRSPEPHACWFPGASGILLQIPSASAIVIKSTPFSNFLLTTVIKETIIGDAGNNEIS